MNITHLIISYKRTSSTIGGRLKILRRGREIPVMVGKSKIEGLSDYIEYQPNSIIGNRVTVLPETKPNWPFDASIIHLKLERVGKYVHLNEKITRQGVVVYEDQVKVEPWRMSTQTTSNKVLMSEMSNISGSVELEIRGRNVLAKDEMGQHWIWADKYDQPVQYANSLQEIYEERVISAIYEVPDYRADLGGTAQDIISFVDMYVKNLIAFVADFKEKFGGKKSKKTEKTQEMAHRYCIEKIREFIVELKTIERFGFGEVLEAFYTTPEHAGIHKIIKDVILLLDKENFTISEFAGLVMPLEKAINLTITLNQTCWEEFNARFFEIKEILISRTKELKAKVDSRRCNIDNYSQLVLDKGYAHRSKSFLFCTYFHDYINIILYSYSSIMRVRINKRSSNQTEEGDSQDVVVGYLFSKTLNDHKFILSCRDRPYEEEEGSPQTKTTELNTNTYYADGIKLEEDRLIVSRTLQMNIGCGIELACLTYVKFDPASVSDPFKSVDFYQTNVNAKFAFCKWADDQYVVLDSYAFNIILVSIKKDNQALQIAQSNLLKIIGAAENKEITKGSFEATNPPQPFQIESYKGSLFISALFKMSGNASLEGKGILTQRTHCLKLDSHSQRFENVAFKVQEHSSAQVCVTNSSMTKMKWIPHPSMMVLVTSSHLGFVNILGFNKTKFISLLEWRFSKKIFRKDESTTNSVILINWDASKRTISFIQRAKGSKNKPDSLLVTDAKLIL